MSKHTRFFAILMAVAIVAVASSGMAATYRVAATGNDSDGSTWASAYQTIGKALAAANTNPGADQIWIVTGGYDVTDAAGAPIEGAMTITSDTLIYGGFAGIETAVGQRASTAVRATVGHATVTVDLNQTTETSTGTQGVFKVDAGLTVLFDQVDVTSGVALISTTADCGQGGLDKADGASLAGRIAGGINTSTNCTLTLTDCKVSGIVCLGTGLGGGAGLFHGGPIQMRRGAQLNMTDCVISDNTAQGASLTNGGVGVVVEGLVNLQGCTFDNNDCGGIVAHAGRQKNTNSLCIMPPCDGESVIDGCTFSNNKGGYWGPLRISYDTTSTVYTITDCVFENNEATEAGAMLMCTGYQPATGTAIPYWGKQKGAATVAVTGCTFTGNRATSSGGGAIREFEGCPQDDITISDCLFEDNYAKYGGAFLAKEWNGFAFENCTFRDNTIRNNGGSPTAQCEGDASTPTVVVQTYAFTNCLFEDNSATGGTSGDNSVLDIGGANAVGGFIKGEVVNCTFIDNTAGTGGQGCVVENRRAGGDDLQVVNCLAANNIAAEMVRASTLGMTGRIANTITGGLTALTGSGSPGLTQSNVVTTADPGVKADGDLSYSSIAIDAGLDSDGVVTIPTADIDGSARLNVPGIGSALTDIGAYEYTNQIRFVDSAAGGANNGTSWTNAFTTLADALAAAADGDEIWITGDQLIAGEAALSVPVNVDIYGGLDGDEVTPAQRDAQDPADRSTVGHATVTVDLNQTTETSTATQGVFKVDAGLTVLFDQVDVTSGVALISTTADCGQGGLDKADGASLAGRIAGGINTSTNCTLTLTDCKVSGIVCLGTGLGGGAGLFHGGPIQMRRGAQLNMTDCVISDNTAQGASLTNGGVGVVVEGLVNLQGCTFDNNDCGGIVAHAGRQKNTNSLCIMPPCDGESVIDGCTFSNNKGGYWGPLRISYDTTSTVYTITDCVFENNEAVEAGAILMCTGYQPATGTAIPYWGKQKGAATVAITGCTFTGNRATSSGGGAIREFEGCPQDDITISDCLFEGNYSAKYGAAFLAKEWNGFAFENCAFNDNTNLANGGAATCQCEGDASTPTVVTQTYAFTNCVFSDNSSMNSGVNNSILDIGGSNAIGGFIDGSVVNCTFVDNTAGVGGQGTVVINRRAGGDDLQVVNCLAGGNTASQLVRAGVLGMTGRIANTVTGGLTPLSGSGAPGFTQSNVDTTGDPGVLPGGKLTIASVGIDTGLDTDGTVAIPAADLEGWTRYDLAGVGIVGRVTDMGAYEFFGGDISVNPSGAIDFGTVDVNVVDTVTTEVSVTNLASAPTDLDFTYEIVGPDAGEFDVSLQSGSTTLAPGATAVLLVTWDTQHVDLTVARDATLRITHNADNAASPVDVSLTGTPIPVGLSVIRVE